MVTLTVPEPQVMDLGTATHADGQEASLRALVPMLDDYEALVTYGKERIRAVAAPPGVDWNSLNERQREQLIDDMLH